ncbi:MAG: AAA family ATPase [Acidimicrobiales bacterium]
MAPSQHVILMLAVGSLVAIFGVAIVSLLVTAPRRGRQSLSVPEPSPRPPAWSASTEGAAGAGASGAFGVAGDEPVAARTREAESALLKPPRHLPATDAHRSKLRFSDVAGLDHAIEELREVADYLSDPARFRALRAELPRGILLHGPPGCGKTLLARALAGETGVPFYSISAASFVEQYVGLGAARVRQLFDEAKKHGRSIIFLDELDAVGRSRNDGSGGAAEFDHTLNQLLVELDGFSGSSGVLILAATNRLELLDPALLRPGRFDRRIKVEPPDCDGRQHILELHARRRPFSDPIDWGRVAAHTAGLVPAELANIVNEAALLAGRRHRPAIAVTDLEEACARQLSGTSGSYLIEDATRWILAVHEAGHALLSQLLRDVHTPSRISILARPDSYERSVWASSEPREVLTKRELLARLILLLGGRAAELNVFGDPSTEAGDDLAHAAAMARRMVARWAMTGRFDLAGMSSAERAPQIEGSAGGEEVRRLVAGAEARARTILADNRPTLVRIARTLAERETLSADELAGLCGGPAASRSFSPPPGGAVAVLPPRLSTAAPRAAG